MTSAQCVHANTRGCDKKRGLSYLKDRYQVQFPVKNFCTYCYNVVYNSLPVLLFSNLEELKKRESVISGWILPWNLQKKPEQF